MNLVKNNWVKKDIEEFHEFTRTLKGNSFNCEWEKRIINTNLECFAKTSTKARNLVSEIKKGNFVSFIDNLVIENLLDSLVVAHLLEHIKDFDMFRLEVSKFAETIDNWASSDTIRFKKKDHQKLYNFALELLKSDKTFVRRTGINIFFELINDENFVDKAFVVLDSLKTESQYYVKMCAAWLLAEIFSKHRDKGLEYFKQHKTNAFIINKGISKCRDSYRVSKEDKDLLLQFKIKEIKND